MKIRHPEKKILIHRIVIEVSWVRSWGNTTYRRDQNKGKSVRNVYVRETETREHCCLTSYPANIQSVTRFYRFYHLTLLPSTSVSPHPGGLDPTGVLASFESTGGWLCSTRSCPALKLLCAEQAWLAHLSGLTLSAGPLVYFAGCSRSLYLAPPLGKSPKTPSDAASPPYTVARS